MPPSPKTAVVPDAEELAFLRAIKRVPADDHVRIVYADWLQEHGRDAAAELIRVQVERRELGNRLPCNMFVSDMDRLRYLRDRTAELIAELAPRCPVCKGKQRVRPAEFRDGFQWNAGDPCPHCKGAGHCPCVFDRGFLTEARVPGILTVLTQRHRFGDDDAAPLVATDYGRALVANHPLLARVVPADRVPSPASVMALPGAFWFRNDSPSPVTEHHLPGVVFDALSGGELRVAGGAGGNYLIRIYVPPADATAALGDSLADTLRELAGTSDA